MIDKLPNNRFWMLGGETDEDCMKRFKADVGMKKLYEIGEQCVTQSNRSTHLPLFVVEQKRRIWGFDSAYCDDYAWARDEPEHEEANEEKTNELEDLCDDYEDTGPWYKCYYKDHFEFVTVCFTEQGCKNYLKINGHNLHEPRIYVHGGYRNKEWEVIRNFLISLTGKSGP